MVTDNDSLVADDINELDKTGLRAALGIDLNDNWTLTAAALYQDLETEGVWEHDTFNFSEDGTRFSRFNPESSNDEFTQFSLTLEGEIGNNSLVYAGSFLDRESEYMTDYSAYGDYITWVDFYACHYGSSCIYRQPGVRLESPSAPRLNEFATQGQRVRAQHTRAKASVVGRWKPALHGWRILPRGRA